MIARQEEWWTLSLMAMKRRPKTLREWPNRSRAWDWRNMEKVQELEIESKKEVRKAGAQRTMAKQQELGIESKKEVRKAGAQTTTMGKEQELGIEQKEKWVKKAGDQRTMAKEQDLEIEVRETGMKRAGDLKTMEKYHKLKIDWREKGVRKAAELIAIQVERGQIGRKWWKMVANTEEEVGKEGLKVHGCNDIVEGGIGLSVRSLTLLASFQERLNESEGRETGVRETEVGEIKVKRGLEGRETGEREKEVMRVQEVITSAKLGKKRNGMKDTLRDTGRGTVKGMMTGILKGMMTGILKGMMTGIVKGMMTGILKGMMTGTMEDMLKQRPLVGLKREQEHREVIIRGTSIKQI
jgi:hypothetical protein